LKNNSNSVEDKIENKISSLGLMLPDSPKIPPSIKTPFAWVRMRENKAYISGHGPQNPNGSITGLYGRVGAELSVEQGYEAAKSAGLSILGSVKRQIGTLDLVIAWLHVRGYVNTVPTFTETTNVINGFSDLILRLYGPEIGAHARSAIGVQALPLGLPVIIEALAEIGNP
jgi:enamine deaminase RidA (YjgF/YER057c/UK114 family)